MKKLFPISAVALLALSGCETVVDVETPPHTPRLALSYTLSNQPATPDYRAFFEVRDLFVSGSQGVLETRQLAGRKDATVQLFDESGQVVEQFRSKARSGSYGYYGQDSLYGYYVPTRNFVGVPGRTYTLRASASGLEPVEATLTMPAVPAIEKVEYVASTSNNNYGGFGGRLTVLVADNAAYADYYMAYARVLDRNGRYWGDVYRDYSAPGADGPDINLSRFQLSSAYGLYSQYPFSDVGGNGQRLSFSSDVLLQYRGSYDPNNPTIPEPAFLEVIVSGITPETYRFYQSLLRYYDTDGNPFAEPAPLHSNVRSGYGLFGGAADAVYRIAL
ncbi:DUF4249 domain-containing protein [Microvirga sp. STR05]|uniref:DUF4249 domain-containing protein n=1 Tax=Hymenobacter duratus TaxID=2771356 RepID=A0ABR8JJG2_9BACT|nr:DUF4249 family protein [Hymenobacter duratus]MBD2715856.1 DUF4249 domain-containing protein [Hymenobacter duratus]MBR7950767.1 DUF4249 domain-containing protein [Microvirga sp. STR05]